MGDFRKCLNKKSLSVKNRQHGGNFLVYLKVILTSFGSLIVLFIVTKLIGNKQMTQINMFDYINSITIGSIAAEMATSDQENFLVPLIAMVIYGASVILITLLSNKSLKIRRFFEGSAIVLLDDSKIYMKNLKKAKLDLNELLAQFRVNGYFDVSQIHSAYLESNGMVSILPKENSRNLTPKDMKLDVTQTKACVILVLDGTLLKENLKESSVTEQWLTKQLKAQGAEEIKDVALASLTDKKNLTVFLKNDLTPDNDYFE